MSRFGGRESRAARPGDGVRRGTRGHDLDKRNALAKVKRERGYSNRYTVPLGEMRNPGEAQWCAEHDRLECTGNKRHGRGRCHSPAIRGTRGCARHSGMTAQEAAAMGEARITAWNAIGAPPPGGNIETGAAVLGMLQMSWLRVSLYAELLRKQTEKGRQQAGAATGGVLAGEGAVSGLIGVKQSAVPGTGELYATGEEIRSLVALEAAERDRVVKYAKIAHDMGIDDKMTDLAARWTDIVAGRVMSMMADLMLTAEQQALVPGVVMRHLANIDMNAVPVQVIEGREA